MATQPPTAIVVDVSALAPDALTLDALARLELAARRGGRRVQLRGARAELRDLLAFAGLEGVLCLEPGGQPEQWEQRLRVEEERELRDPPA